ncbi:hypothetical protein [Spiroplasma floricola]|uniref:Uncharacterized protein n=1 Tax=Spiroplasma floricola 23-6 TaxID=1336749 RepID=A0A2K8SCR0_9MOLU|nr:hypothetical protein [Spiroplasma floricola]AUB31223.1 hypothetical protein SFLOR_v1c01620 [Spiroplasma floricola 23-6]
MKEKGQIGVLPTWAMILIVVFFIIGLAISIWGFISAFNSKKKRVKTNLEFLFKDKQIIKYGNTFKEKNGIYALIFTNFDENDYFRPIFIFQAQDFDLISKNIIEEIKSEKNLSIKEYMNEKNLKKEDIHFVKLEKENNKELLETWIKKTNSKTRGFNQ